MERKLKHTEKKNEKALNKLSNELNKLKKFGAENQDPFQCNGVNNENLQNAVLKSG